jgi:ABC-2 type transport system permease protein
MSAPVAVARGAEEHPRFRELLTAEWIKLWSLRSTYLVLSLGSLAIIALDINSAIADYLDLSASTAAERASFNPLNFSLPAMLLLMIAAGSVGALTIVGEYDSGLIRATFAAVPARRSVVAAKVVVISAVMFGLGAAIAVISFWMTQTVLSGRHVGWSIAHPGALRAIVAVALLAPACALVGMGIGALIRHTATTIVAVVVVLGVIPQFFNSHQHRWAADVGNAMLVNAHARLVYPFAFGGRYPATITGSWIVYALWPLVAIILAMVVVHRRDV